MDIGISFIIPCFNSAETIERCLDSIKENNCPDSEIIIIDDCSVDNTVELIEEYKHNCSMNIQLYKNNNNLGAGQSRNKGIKYATKKYITFIDSDDVIKSNFYQIISQNLKDSDTDCVVFNAEIKNNASKKKMCMFYGGDFKAGEVDIKKTLVYIKGCTCGKVYKTEVIKKNNIQYASLKRNEDLVFTKVAISVCKKIQYISEALYEYWENDNSLRHNKSLLDVNNAYIAYDMIEEKSKNKGFENELHSIYLIEVIYGTTIIMMKQGDNIKNCKRHFKKLLKNFCFLDKYFWHYNKKYKLVVLLFKVGIFYPVYKLLNE